MIEEKLRNMSRNLAQLCKSYNSVADVCRRIGINRQQFNKYLAGKHLPSPRMQSAMAQFFMIEEGDIFKPPNEFSQIFEGPRVDISWEMRDSRSFREFLPFIVSSGQDLKPYHGIYYRYHNSSIHRGRVLRSVLYLYEHNGITQYVTVERFPSPDTQGTMECIFKYYGISILCGGRVFFFDMEDIQKNEITFSIFLPKFRNALQTLFGIVTGVAATPLREPFSTRAALSFQGDGPIRKGHLKMATTLLPDDQDIPAEIRKYLSDPANDVIWGGR
jgi:transcriptional regulator with XRE-family HTH domain